MATSQSQSFKGGSVSPGASIEADDLKNLVVNRKNDVGIQQQEIYEPLVGKVFNIGRAHIKVNGTEIGSYDPLDTEKDIDIDVPAAQVQSDWDEADNTKPDYIKNKPNLGLKADKANITGATKCKITYNSQGIVTAGADLSASDIPNLAASKITSGQFSTERIADDAITAAKVKDDETLPVNVSGRAAASNIANATVASAGGVVGPSSIGYQKLATIRLTQPNANYTGFIANVTWRSSYSVEATGGGMLYVSLGENNNSTVVTRFVAIKTRQNSYPDARYLELGYVRKNDTTIEIWAYHGTTWASIFLGVVGGKCDSVTYEGINFQSSAPDGYTSVAIDGTIVSSYGAVGSPTIPVYVDADGQVLPCDPSQMSAGLAQTLPRGYAPFNGSSGVGYKKIAEINPPSTNNDIIAVFEVYETCAFIANNSFRGLLTAHIRNAEGSYVYLVNFVADGTFRNVSLSVHSDPNTGKLLIFAHKSDDSYCGLYIVLAGSGGWRANYANSNVTLFSNPSAESVSSYPEVTITTIRRATVSPDGAGSPSTPVYVDSDGQVKPCDPSQMSVGNAEKWDGYAISVGTVVSNARTISIA
jgi:hypothetical protein